MSSLILCILSVVGLYNIFEKAGIEGWKALIPFYNLWNEVKLVNRPVGFFWGIVIPYLILFLVIFIWGVFGFLEGAIGINDNIMGAILPFVIGLVIVFGIFSSIVMSIILKNDIAKSFGKSKWFTVGVIFLPFIFYPILGFDKSEYKKLPCKHCKNGVCTTHK